ncbi:SH3 domain-containing protein [Olleya sp. Bg11-27]|uniref:SH3 domain-containing protein n=1 Tax=Olleya sp. Bg11-27 TaxID=2058135 RepID=UPI000C307188|nr:SH3 domain-containing protein [Olleya sp. Bg11-27]AUC76025.1 hypothetical protein CW732_10275 [Olleya sp. Bg11-27]
MKYIITLILILCLFSSCKEGTIAKEKNVQKKDFKIVTPLKDIYTIKIGLIDDSDGYTNIRLKPDSSSLIIGTILEDEYFFYKISKDNWFSVKTLNGLKGYVHKTRIINANSKEQLCVRINGFDPSDFSYDKDTIININTLNKKGTYFIRKLLYPKIKVKEKLKEKITFSENDIKIEISKNKFDPKEYKIVKEGGFVNVKDTNGLGGYMVVLAFQNMFSKV